MHFLSKISKLYTLGYLEYSTFIDPSSLDFPNPSTYTLPKTERRELSNDEIDGYQGIAVKSEFDNINPDIFNEIIPVMESDIPGYAKDIIQERRLQALGKNFYHVTIFRPVANILIFFISLVCHFLIFRSSHRFPSRNSRRSKRKNEIY